MLQTKFIYRLIVHDSNTDPLRVCGTAGAVQRKSLHGFLYLMHYIINLKEKKKY